MSKKGASIVNFVENMNNKLGKYASLIIIFVMFLITIETLLRYFFNSPTEWAWPITRQLFALFTLFGGTFALLYGAHIRVEMLYVRFSPRMTRAANIFAFILFALFLGVLIWQGVIMATQAWTLGERTIGVFKMPVYPLKTLFPICFAIFFIQGIINFLIGTMEKRRKKVE
jgi:TRAP-type mannitol/chloroaromatic compound transport system permease small subunit